MGRGNVCVYGPYEGLFYIDNDYIHVYRKTYDFSEEPEVRLLGDLSYEELTSGTWLYDNEGTANEESYIWECFTDSFTRMFPSMQKCSKWIDRNRYALLENKLFYVAVADNEWSLAVMLVQKEHWCYDYSGLQKQHYQRYLDGIRDALFEQFETLGTYSGAWTSGTIKRPKTA